VHLLIALIVIVGSLAASADDADRQPPPTAPPEGCSHAKTAIARAAAEADALLLKSTDDPLADQTDVLHYRLEFEVEPTIRFLGGSNTMTVESRVDDVTAFRFWLHPAMTIGSVEVDGAAAMWRRLDSAIVEVELGRSRRFPNRGSLTPGGRSRRTAATRPPAIS